MRTAQVVKVAHTMKTAQVVNIVFYFIIIVICKPKSMQVTNFHFKHSNQNSEIYSRHITNEGTTLT